MNQHKRNYETAALLPSCDVNKQGEYQMPSFFLTSSTGVTSLARAIAIYPFYDGERK